jgi:hypothetical protein
MVAPFLLFTPAFFGLFATSLAVLLPIFLTAARAYRYDLRHAAVTAFSLGLIVAWTVPSAFGPYPEDGAFLRAFAEPGAIPAALLDVGRSAERQANVLLYIPAGAFAALMARRFVPVATALSGLSWLIELAQAVSGLRDGSLPDWVYNSAGAMIGVAVAYLWHLLPSGLPAPPSPAPPSPALPSPALPSPAPPSPPLPSPPRVHSRSVTHRGR